MPEIKPFCGILYNPEKVEVSSVVAPPYDVISPRQQTELYDASPHNVVRLILGREEDRYNSAATHFERWKKENVLVKDAVPSIYMLMQDFVMPMGKSMERRGFIARCRLEEFGTGSILPHEKTLAKPKEDRFRLLQSAHANFSQIFGLYADPQREFDRFFDAIESTPPLIDTVFEGVRNRLWRVINNETIITMQRHILDKKIFIADGHHRYETALQFRDTMRAKYSKHTGEEPYNYIMMYCTNLHDEGLVILPTHRLLHGLPRLNSDTFLHELQNYFQLTIHPNERELIGSLRNRRRYAFGLILPSPPNYVLCWLDDTLRIHSLMNLNLNIVVKELDVTILHKIVFEKILGISPSAQERKLNLDYINDASAAVAAVKENRAQAAFLVNPTLVEQVRAVAEAGCTMPQKSTYFFPKLLSGLVINSLDEE